MKERNGEHPFGDEGQIIAVIVFLAAWVSDSFFIHVPTVFTNILPLYVRLVISGLLLLIAILLYRSSHFIVQHEQRPNYVVTQGAFRYVRHPLYLSSLVFYLALVISTLSLPAFVFWIMVFVFYNDIAGYEEQLLLRKFGDAYQTYIQQTGRWLPHAGLGRRLSITR